jgi:hypothetical protein
MESDRRRVEDRYRDEHHDAHAKTIAIGGHEQRPASAATSVIDPGGQSSRLQGSVNASRERRGHMQIRIVKNLPAPMMDGFDVRGMRVEQTYDVDRRVANYLIIAGYAIAVDDDDGELTKTSVR